MFKRSLILLSLASMSVNASTQSRMDTAEYRLNHYSEADLAVVTHGVPYRHFLEGIMVKGLYGDIEGAQISYTAGDISISQVCEGIEYGAWCVNFEATAAGIEQAILVSFAPSLFSDQSGSQNTSNGNILPPELPLQPIEQEPTTPDPIVIVKPIDPGFGVAPIEPGYGVKPIGEEEKIPVVGLGSFRAMTLEQQAQTLTQYINNNNSSSKGQVVVVDQKLMWETKDGKQKPLKDSNKVIAVLEEAHKKRVERRENRPSIDPIDIIIEPIDPGYGVNPIPSANLLAKINKWVDNNDPTGNDGQVVYIDGKLMWLNKSGNVKPLRDAKNVREAFQATQNVRQARIEERTKDRAISLVQEENGDVLVLRNDKLVVHRIDSSKAKKYRNNISGDSGKERRKARDSKRRSDVKRKVNEWRKNNA